MAWRIGAALEAAEWRDREESRERLPSALAGVPRKPHLRRAHWHRFWDDNGRAEPSVHGLPPIPAKVLSIRNR